MKWKLKNSYFDAEDGISFVEISTRLGCFEGYSFLHPDDKDIASNFEGCHYAEGRAVINYLKQELYIVTIKINTLTNLLYDYQTMKYYKDNKKEIKCLKIKIKDLEEKRDKIKNNISNIKQHIDYSIEHYRQEKEDFIKKINKEN